MQAEIVRDLQFCESGEWCASRDVGPFLDRRHYLGAVGRGIAWSDELGVLVLAKPTSRRQLRERFFRIARDNAKRVMRMDAAHWLRVSSGVAAPQIVEPPRRVREIYGVTTGPWRGRHG